MSHDPYAEPSALGPVEKTEPGEVEVTESVSDAWATMLDTWEVGILGFLLSTALFGMSVFTCFGAFVLAPVLSWGYTALLLNAVDGDPEVDDVLTGFGRYGEALPSMLSYYMGMAGFGLITLVAAAVIDSLVPLSIAPIFFTLLIAGAFTTAGRFLLAPYYIVDQGMGGIEAMQAAWRATRGQEISIFFVFLLTFLVGSLGFLFCGFGALLTLPLAHTILAAVYRQLEPLDDEDDYYLEDPTATDSSSRSLGPGSERLN